MTYSDYVQIYDVRDCSGATTSDDLATRVSKIAEWINSEFSDIVTAVNMNDTKVVFYDKDLKVGVAWGKPYNTSGSNSSLTSCRYGVYSSGSSAYEVSSNYISNFSYYYLGGLKLFVCITNYGYVMDFINTDYTNYISHPKLIVATGTNSIGGTGKFALISDLDASSSSATGVWNVATSSSSKATSRSAQQTFMGLNNGVLGRTLLTRFTPSGSDIIADGLYKMNGVMPACKSIFELNGNKYLSLNYNAYGGGCGLALRLD